MLQQKRLVYLSQGDSLWYWASVPRRMVNNNSKVMLVFFFLHEKHYRICVGVFVVQMALLSENDKSERMS